MNEKQTEALIAQVRELTTRVDKLTTALIGNIDNPDAGALHKFTKMFNDFYRPDEPKLAVDRRLRRLEDERHERRGFIAACTLFGTLVGVLGEHFLSKLFGG